MSLIIFILIGIFLLLVGSFIPIGNENSTVRRLPWVTFSLMGLNAIIFFVSLPAVASQEEELIKAHAAISGFMRQHQELLADDNVRQKLVDNGLMTREESEEIDQQVKSSSENADDYKFWLRSSEAQSLRDQLDEKLTAFRTASEQRISYEWGFAPNGKWKIHQLFTSAFLHGSLFHLFGNLIFFFAVAFALEDLWGRGVFLTFYLLGAAASLIPSIISPGVVPTIGASGALSATMGAFMLRLPKTRIKLFCIQFFWLRLLLTRKVAIFFVPSYVYFASYFISQVIYWYVDNKAGGGSSIAYSVHVAGFIFGAGFALLMKATNYEEKVINPNIEAKVSFAAAPAVDAALKHLDQGDAYIAERRLRTYLSKAPDDTNALLALIQVYQTLANFDQLNMAYARLIRIHLTNQDKEAALYAYDNLLSAFPDHKVEPRIQARDWLTICEYLRERQMTREAGVEYERMVKHHPDDPLAGKAAVQGGEASLAANDVERAMRMFSIATQLSLPTALANRATMGVERCEKILSHRPSWTKRAPRADEFSPKMEEEKA
jgi:membrane associated rhomboid family serine protease